MLSFAGRAEILEHPQNVSTTAQAFLNEVSTNGQSNAGFRCKVSADGQTLVHEPQQGWKIQRRTVHQLVFGPRVRLPSVSGGERAPREGGDLDQGRRHFPQQRASSGRAAAAVRPGHGQQVQPVRGVQWETEGIAPVRD